MKNYYLILTLILGSLCVVGCGSKNSSSSSTPSISESEMVAAAVGGASNVSSSTGGQALLQNKSTNLFANIKSSFTLIDKAFASTSCPTIWNDSSSCGVSGSVETLTYSSCSFGTYSNLWNGSQLLTFTGLTPSCSSVPAFANGVTMTRTWSTGTTVSVSGGYTVLIDASGSGATSGWSTSIPNSGVTVSFANANPVIRTITITGIHTTSSYSNVNVFDHTINSSGLSVNSSNVITSGTVTLQHNYARYIATSTLTNVGFTAGCCFPTSGSITTTYSNGLSSQTLAFNSTCGSSTLNGVSHTLNYCF